MGVEGNGFEEEGGDTGVVKSVQDVLVALGKGSFQRLEHGQSVLRVIEKGDFEFVSDILSQELRKKIKAKDNLDATVLPVSENDHSWDEAFEKAVLWMELKPKPVLHQMQSVLRWRRGIQVGPL